VLTVAQGLAQNSGNLMLRSIVADVADKHRLDHKEDRTGLYFSVFSLAGKAATAVAVGIALPLVSWLGFDPKAVNSPATLQGLAIVFAIGPAIAHAFSAWLVSGFPLDEAAHAEVRRALDAQGAALAPAE
jgi:Na+/melibiose symporter-like transporter